MPKYYCASGVETAMIGKDGKKLIHGNRDLIDASSKSEAEKSYIEKHGVKPAIVHEIKIDNR